MKVLQLWQYTEKNNLMTSITTYPDLEKVAKQKNVPADLLVKIYELESDFHAKIIKEDSFDKRQDLYNEFYQKLYKLPFPKTDNIAFFKHEVKVKTELVKLFKNELTNKSILDVGCGSGCFLYAMSQSDVPHQKLLGVDAKKPDIVQDEVSQKISFEEINVVKFSTQERFDLAISDNVFEHITPADTHSYLGSIRSTLNENGTLILLIPHRNFGPWDYTMIRDDSRSGTIMATCAHVNETTYTEVIQELKQHGFKSFKSPLPFVALSPIRKLFPSFRLNANFYANLERSFVFDKILKKIKINGRSLFRMEVIIIAKL
jgi:2-polyprenyl-3-methyl-5-hydroxy-6-metoxy-1,4-benzoquinol methylase